MKKTIFLITVVLISWASTANAWPWISPYAYCHNNPVGLIDPDGREIIGVTRNDAAQAVADIRAIFSGNEFEQFRNLIVQSGKKHDGRSLASINQDALSNAFKGVNLSNDQQALVDMVVNTINSPDRHIVEYVSDDKNISKTGAEAFYNDFNNAGLPMDLILDANGGLPSSIISNFGGGGLTVQSKRGTHTVIVTTPNLHPNGMSVTFGHEIFGHGRSLALGRGSSNQHVDAIQTENLILRIMGIQYINNGSNHGPQIIIPNASDIPNYR